MCGGSQSYFRGGARASEETRAEPTGPEEAVAPASLGSTTSIAGFPEVGLTLWENGLVLRTSKGPQASGFSHHPDCRAFISKPETN